MKVTVKLPQGARLDRDRLATALAAALAGEDEKIWQLNNVPAIAQLEESLYEAGTHDIQQAWEATARHLGLPVLPMQKSTARLELGGSLQDRVRAAFQGEGVMNG